MKHLVLLSCLIGIINAKTVTRDLSEDCRNGASFDLRTIMQEQDTNIYKTRVDFKLTKSKEDQSRISKWNLRKYYLIESYKCNM